MYKLSPYIIDASHGFPWCVLCKALETNFEWLLGLGGFHATRHSHFFPPCCLISDMFSSATVASSCFLCIASSMRSQDFCKDGLRKLIGQAAELRFGLALLQHQSICLHIHMFTCLHMSSLRKKGKCANLLFQRESVAEKAGLFGPWSSGAGWAHAECTIRGCRNESI